MFLTTDISKVNCNSTNNADFDTKNKIGANVFHVTKYIPYKNRRAR